MREEKLRASSKVLSLHRNTESERPGERNTGQLAPYSRTENRKTLSNSQRIANHRMAHAV